MSANPPERLPRSGTALRLLLALLWAVGVAAQAWLVLGLVPWPVPREHVLGMVLVALATAGAAAACAWCGPAPPPSAQWLGLVTFASWVVLAFALLVGIWSAALVPRWQPSAVAIVVLLGSSALPGVVALVTVADVRRAVDRSPRARALRTAGCTLGGSAVVAVVWWALTAATV